MAEQRVRAGKTNVFKEPLDGELKKIWGQLDAVLIGPEWRFYSHDDGLYVQRYNPEDKIFKSLALLESDGSLSLAGTLSESQTLSNVGNS